MIQNKQEETTLVFTKTHPLPNHPSVILNYFENLLGERISYEKLFRERIENPGQEFWEDFYCQIEPRYSKVFEVMTQEFGHNPGEMEIGVYRGNGIIDIGREVVGSRLYMENPLWTIRGKYGNPKMSYRTVIHASDHEGVEKDLWIFMKYGLIPREISRDFTDSKELKEMFESAVPIG